MLSEEGPIGHVDQLVHTCVIKDNWLVVYLVSSSLNFKVKVYKSP